MFGFPVRLPFNLIFCACLYYCLLIFWYICQISEDRHRQLEAGYMFYIHLYFFFQKKNRGWISSKLFFLILFFALNGGAW